ncbi:MAG: hypothetical protein PF448_05110 [Bacteroidales bacterium]|jgi:hypothetical protein|nr:hypothetical protein [Bacteroidales bacterium]
MKKNNRILFFILIALLTISAIVFFTRYEFSRELVDGKEKFQISRKNTSLKVLRDFAVQDTAQIDKIFLVDKDNNQILLERENSHWLVNKKTMAREDLKDILLETIHRVEVYSPVPKTRQEYVIRDLASNGIKCEIYQSGKKVKTYYVGGVTQDNLGTYMLLENSAEPFIVSIPGFSGYLTTRYSTSEKEWVSKRVYSYSFNQIASVEVEYPNEPSQSYKMVNGGNNYFELIRLDNKLPVVKFDTVKVKQQIGRFKKVGFEFIVPEDFQSQRLDSVRQYTPIYTFNVTDVSGNSRKLECYARPNRDELKNDEGIPYENDIERLYGVFDDQLVVMQYYTTDMLTMRLNYFLE